MSSPQKKIDSSRGSLALFGIYDDSVATARVNGAKNANNEIIKEKQPTPDIMINKFWNNPENKELVDAFMNNKLCIDAAQGKPEAIQAYKRYAVQDYFYLVDWFRFRVLRLATLPHDDFKLDELSSELDSVHKSLKSSVESWFQTCIDELGITPEEFHVERTIGELAYGQFLEMNGYQSDWYNLHVILIGCYWAWSKLGLVLYNDPKTDKNTPFFKLWIEPNVDTSFTPPEMAESAKVLSRFLDANEQMYSSAARETQIQDLFRTALRLEVGLFNSAYDAPVKRPGPVPGLPAQIPFPGEGGKLHNGDESKDWWRKALGLHLVAHKV